MAESTRLRDRVATWPPQKEPTSTAETAHLRDRVATTTNNPRPPRTEPTSTAAPHLPAHIAHNRHHPVAPTEGAHLDG